MNKVILSTSNLFEPNKMSIISRIERLHKNKNNLETILELEEALSKYHRCKHCITFSTGFWALVAMVMLKSKEGCNEVLMPSLTYRRLADVVYWAGKKPVFVDIDEKNLAISPQAIEKNICSKTALILAVHPIINCCSVNEIIKISENHSIPVLFDAVESVHETYKGKKVGSFKVGEVFSLHASKLINGMEGGYVCTDDDELSDRLLKFRDRRNTSKTIGLSSPLNAIHSIFALESLNEVDKNINHNRDIYNHYKSIFKNIDGIRLLNFDEKEKTSYKNIVVEVLDNFPLNRNELLKLLNNNDILARAYYYPPLHKKKQTYDFRITNMKNTINASARYLNLPCGYRVNISDVDLVCTLIREAINE